MEPISVWRWQDAPKALKERFSDVGEATWLAEIPPALMADRVGWLVADAFGLNGTTRGHPLKKGWGIRVGTC